MKYSNILCGIGAFALLPLALYKTTAGNHQKQLPTFRPVAAAFSNNTAISKLVLSAEAFKATLTASQVALLQREYSKTDAVRWSNFPQAASRPNRVGLSLKDLDAKQMEAFKALMSVALATQTANEGFDEMEGVMAADDYFGKTTGKSDMFGHTNYFIAFLGVPSTSGLWELQFGGHHFAFADTYNKGAVIGGTPSFRGVEPIKPVTVEGHTYAPIAQEQQAFADLISALSATQKTTAKLSATYNDVVLGPGEDGKFPVTKQGLKMKELSSTQQQVVIKAIGLYVNDLDPATAQTIMKKYTAELADTYVAYSGSGTMNQTADYIRIDGPGIWIEYAVQPSRDFPGTTHPHSVWRDHQSDYGGN